MKTEINMINGQIITIDDISDKAREGFITKIGTGQAIVVNFPDVKKYVIINTAQINFISTSK